MIDIFFISRSKAIEATMPRRGRPRKNHSIYSFKELVEYTSDSETDSFNVQHNAMQEVTSERDRSPLNRGRQLQGVQNAPSPPRDAPEQQQEQVQPSPPREAPEQQQQQVQPSPPRDAPEQQQQKVQPSPPREAPEQQQQQVQNAPSPPRYAPEQQQQQPIFPIHQQQQEQEDDDHRMQEEEEEDDIQHQAALSDDSMDDDFPLPDGDVEDYDSILKQLKSKWILVEIDHSVSKSASELFWKLALHYFPKLHSCIGKKKTPQFKTIRRHMYNNLVPPIQLEIGYKDRNSGEVTIVKDTITPIKRFSPAKYEKLYEIGTVQVSLDTFFNLAI